MIINFLQEAEEELIKAAFYYEQQQSGLGIEFIREVRPTCNLILASPKAANKVRKEIRRRLVRRFPFSVLYQEVEDSIQVIAIAHQRRKPRYWVKRKQM